MAFYLILIDDIVCTINYWWCWERVWCLDKFWGVCRRERWTEKEIPLYRTNMVGTISKTATYIRGLVNGGWSSALEWKSNVKTHEWEKYHWNFGKMCPGARKPPFQYVVHCIIDASNRFSGPLHNLRYSTIGTTCGQDYNPKKLGTVSSSSKFRSRVYVSPRKWRAKVQTAENRSAISEEMDLLEGH
jgi:hypothetical protein